MLPTSPTTSDAPTRPTPHTNSTTLPAPPPHSSHSPLPPPSHALSVVVVLSWVLNQLESAGFEIRSEETIGVHYSATIKRWYDNWKANEAVITAKYGQRWYRLWLWFLAWSVISPEQGSAS